MRAVALALLLLLPALAGCLDPTPEPRASTDPSEGSDPAPMAGNGSISGPVWSFVDTEGVGQSRDASLGKPTLLFFMATWCSTCRGKSPMLKTVAEDYAERIHVYSVSVDPQDSNGLLEKWKQDRGHPWPHGRAGGMTDTFDVRVQSTFVILDQDGRLREKWEYPGATEGDLRRTLDSLLDS